jgi:hypothetical protein
MTSRKTNHSRVLSFQTLENRQLMAGNVTASVTNHNLVITGDNKDNAIQVVQTGNGAYEILSLDGSTKINGKSSKTFTGITGDVTISMKGGNDNVYIGQDLSGTPTQFTTLPRNLTVNMGDGGNNFHLNGVTVSGKMSLTAGVGSDLADIFYSHIGYSNVNGGANDCTINLGAGANAINMDFAVVERDLNLNEGSSSYDGIVLEGGWTGRNLNIQTGSGNDYVNLDRMNVLNNLNISTGGGNDTVILGGYDAAYESYGTPGEVDANSVNVDLGAGNDKLQIGGTQDNHSVGGVASNSGSYNGGAGQDIYENYSGENVVGSFSGFDFYAQIVSEKGLTVDHTYSPPYKG